jgi:hypothetical protein
MKLKKTIIFILVFTSFLSGFSTAAVILLTINPLTKSTVTAVDNIVNLKDFLDPDLVLFDNLTRNSPDNKKVVFVTAKDYGMKEATIWVIDRDGRNIKKIIKTNNYSYFTNPIWSPDGKKLAYLRIYPFEIYTDDLNGNKEKIYSEFDHKDDNLLNTSQGYGGEAYFVWNSDNQIEFENNKEIPAGKYAINVATKEVKRIGTFESKLSYKNVPWFSQRSTIWGSDQLGTCDKTTIYTAGCAVTAAAMILKYYGVELTPRELNTMLINNNDQGYVNGCDIRWNIVQNYTENVIFKGAYYNDYNLDRLNYELDTGHPVILGFNKVPFTNIPHWVVAVKREGKKYLINDPWLTSFEYKSLDDFGGRFDHMMVYYPK